MWFQGYEEYKNLGEYVVQIIGYCVTGYLGRVGDMSIYEYMRGGTLQQHLHGELLFDIVQSKSK
jgi:hypothetical protein